ncbi:MAG: hypothetical protein ACLR7U_06875 [Ruthenibacterium lactatiformans]
MEYLEDQLARMEIMLSVYAAFVKRAAVSLRQPHSPASCSACAPIIHMVDDTTSTIAKVRGDSAVDAKPSSRPKNGWQRARLISSAQRTMATPKCWPRCAKRIRLCAAATFPGAAVATNTSPNAVAIVYQGEKRR